MKYTEFEKDICQLGKEYFVTQDDRDIHVRYRSSDILTVSKKRPFIIGIYEYNDDLSNLLNCPKEQEVWNLVAKLAATPLNERKEERKWVICICKTPAYSVLWSKIGTPKRDDFGSFGVRAEPFSLEILHNYTGKSRGIKEDFIFTDTEYEELLAYLKTLTDGDYQVEMAEHSKTETLIRSGYHD